MKKNILITLLCLPLVCIAKEFKIIAKSDPRITTHEISSGEFIIGITDNGGGVINKVYIPGLGDIMDKNTDMYGRAGQVAIRDAAHGGRFNPTQAGFFETLGTQCEVVKTEGRLTVLPRPMALWHGDGEYDFTEWENIGEDPYRNDNGNSDIDGLDESQLVGKQETEVTSEFDYYGFYENVNGKHGITTSAFRHYFEIRFVREPSHCVEQFRPGTKLFNPSALRADISVKQPKGKHAATYVDLSGFSLVWSLRHDLAKWTHKYVYYRDQSGKWISSNADVELGTQTDSTVFILADSNNPNQGKALGLYRPSTDINTNFIIGRNEVTNKIVYKDNRDQLPKEGSKINYSYKRVPTMSKYGFGTRGSGIINRIRLDKDVYESYRSEYYILYGTPQEIMDAVKMIDAAGDIPVNDVDDPYGPSGFERVANEGETVEVTGTMDIAYGAKGKYAFLYNQTENCGCDSVTFGSNPAPEEERHCYAKQVVFADGISLLKKQLELTVEQSEKLNAIITPSNTKNKAMSWTSLNPNIASVSQEGLVKAMGFGSTKIIVKTDDGGFTDTCTVIVVDEIFPNIEFKDGEQDVNPAINLLDGVTDDDHRWSAQVYPKSVVIDYGKLKEFTGSKVYTYKNRSYHYTIGISEFPDRDFTTVVEQNGAAPNHPIEHSFAKTTGRYVKLTVTGCTNYASNWVSINELEMITAVSSSTSAIAPTKQISIFPNPANQYLTLTLPEYKGDSDIRILNLYGQVVISRKLRRQKININLDEIPTGVYVLKISLGGIQYTRRFIKK